jgi:peroxiredoxin
MKKPVLFLLALAVLALTAKASEPFKPGDYASDFNLKNLDGKMVSLSSLSDAKGFIVVFSCNTCPVVHKYEDRIVALNDKFSGKGYPVVAINSNDMTRSPGDSYSEMQRYAKSKGFKFEYLYDESQDVARRYGATNTPHVYVLTKEGDNLKVAYVGAIDNNADNASMADKKYVEDAVNALLKGNQVQVTGTKAIGCTIKWKQS